MTTEERKHRFILKAKAIHNEKYDYSLVEYNGSECRVDILCPIHGKFSMSPHSHLKGYGCPYCSGKVIHVSDFLSKAMAVHGDKYDYSKMKFVNGCTPAIITCPIHGDFEQKPADHMSGHGCAKCGHVDNRKMVLGVGYNSSSECEPSKSLCYHIWFGMLQRCYTKTDRYSNYSKCSVCDEWLDFANFKAWFNDHYVEGCNLIRTSKLKVIKFTVL